MSEAIVVDTSALLAVLYDEEDAAYYAEAIATAQACCMSASNFLEAAINIDASGDADASRLLDYFMQRAEIEVTSVTHEQAQVARQAYRNYGKGRHKAGLNFGDCFAYALARVMTAPLLFKGEDFVHTDILTYAPPVEEDGEAG
jgi:ribonuclease VapC